MMALGGGVIIPNVLRWYWWRMNGWGYALGTFGGILLSLVSLFTDTVPDYVVFPLIVTASLLLSIIGSLVTRPVDKKLLKEFYLSIHPFGMWKPVREDSGLTSSERDNNAEKASRSVLNVVLGMIAIAAGYLFPMYLVGHWYGRSLLCLGFSMAAVLALKYTWYRHLN